MKKTIIIIGIGIMASCSPKLMNFSQADADPGATKFPGLTLAQLKEGKEIHDKKCTVCHGAKSPGSWTEAQWRSIVPNMAEGSKQHGKGEITAAEQDLILKYVITMGPGKKNS